MPEFDYAIEYRDIPGLSGYKAGSDGTIWSCRPLNGIGKLTSVWRQLRPHAAGRGHRQIRSGGKTYRVHRLILEAFVGPCPPGMECCHFPDRDPSNNNLSNLRWDTPSSNQQDRFAHGTECRGETHPRSILNEKNVLFIRENAKSLSRRLMAEMFGVSKRAIQFVIRRRNWRHI